MRITVRMPAIGAWYNAARPPMHDSKGHLPVWAHALTTMLSLVVGLVAGLALGIVVVNHVLGGCSAPVAWSVLIGSTVLCIGVPQLAMHRWIHGRCAQCGGRCRIKSIRPHLAHYVCEQCGFVDQETFYGEP